MASARRDSMVAPDCCQRGPQGSFVQDALEQTHTAVRSSHTTTPNMSRRENGHQMRVVDPSMHIIGRSGQDLSRRTTQDAMQPARLDPSLLNAVQFPAAENVSDPRFRSLPNTRADRPPSATSAPSFATQQRPTPLGAETRTSELFSLTAATARNQPEISDVSPDIHAVEPTLVASAPKSTAAEETPSSRDAQVPRHSPDDPILKALHLLPTMEDVRNAPSKAGRSRRKTIAGGKSRRPKPTELMQDGVTVLRDPNQKHHGATGPGATELFSNNTTTATVLGLTKIPHGSRKRRSLCPVSEIDPSAGICATETIISAPADKFTVAVRRLPRKSANRSRPADKAPAQRTHLRPILPKPSTARPVLTLGAVSVMGSNRFSTVDTVVTNAVPSAVSQEPASACRMRVYTPIPQFSSTGSYVQRTHVPPQQQQQVQRLVGFSASSAVPGAPHAVWNAGACRSGAPDQPQMSAPPAAPPQIYVNQHAACGTQQHRDRRLAIPARPSTSGHEHLNTDKVAQNYNGSGHGVILDSVNDITDLDQNEEAQQQQQCPELRLSAVLGTTESFEECLADVRMCVSTPTAKRQRRSSPYMTEQDWDLLMDTHKVATKNSACPLI